MTAQPRAARWSRVSSAKQSTSDREGIPYQIELQQAALNALGAHDTGLAWQVTHSGGSVHQTNAWSEMLARAGKDFDVLVVAYTSRLGRDAEELLRAVRLIRAAGASVYFSEEGCHTADEPSWEAFAREAVEAESYRRRLSRTMKRTYASRASRRGLPAGVPPYGFRSDWTHEPTEAAKVRAIFETYAKGQTSLTQLATQHALAEEQVKVVIRNPAYAGRAQHNGTIYPGSMKPVVDPALWDQVAEIRASRRFATSQPHLHRPSMLRGRFYCACGAKPRLDGRDGQQRHRVRHLSPCTAWGRAERRTTNQYEAPIREALTGIRLTDQTIEQIVRERPDSQRQHPTPITFKRERAKLTRDLTERRISGTEFDTRMNEIDQEEWQHHDDVGRSSQPTISDDQLRAALRDFRGMIDSARGKTHEDEVWANIVERYVERIEHIGPSHVGLQPSAAGLAAITPGTLPQRVEWAVRGSNPRPPRCKRGALTS